MASTLLTGRFGIDELRKLMVRNTSGVSSDRSHDDDPLGRYENEGGRIGVERGPSSRARPNGGVPGGAADRSGCVVRGDDGADGADGMAGAEPGGPAA